MNEILLLLVPVAIIAVSVFQQSQTFKSFEKLFYYSKYIALFIPFILVYLKPELKDKLISVFYQIDSKPMYQNMEGLMSSYMDLHQGNKKFRGNMGHTYGRSNFNYSPHMRNQSGPIPMNQRMNLINPKNMRSNFQNKVRHKRNVSESKKKYIASQQKWHCTHCHQMLDNTFEVDHIIPLYKGGTNDLHNLEALCRNCHGKKTFKDKLGI